VPAGKEAQRVCAKGNEAVSECHARCVQRGAGAKIFPRPSEEAFFLLRARSGK